MRKRKAIKKITKAIAQLDSSVGLLQKTLSQMQGEEIEHLTALLDHKDQELARLTRQIAAYETDTYVENKEEIERLNEELLYWKEEAARRQPAPLEESLVIES
jgi:succinate dehydrogenase flavin-adding protein (antitoxin of CptAB toxin-antitoxin module)